MSGSYRINLRGGEIIDVKKWRELAIQPGVSFTGQELNELLDRLEAAESEHNRLKRLAVHRSKSIDELLAERSELNKLESL